MESTFTTRIHNETSVKKPPLSNSFAFTLCAFHYLPANGISFIDFNARTKMCILFCFHMFHARYISFFLFSISISRPFCHTTNSKYSLNSQLNDTFIYLYLRYTQSYTIRNAIQQYHHHHHRHLRVMVVTASSILLYLCA